MRQTWRILVKDLRRLWLLILAAMIASTAWRTLMPSREWQVAALYCANPLCWLALIFFLPGNENPARSHPAAPRSWTQPFAAKVLLLLLVFCGAEVLSGAAQRVRGGFSFWPAHGEFCLSALVMVCLFSVWAMPPFLAACLTPSVRWAAALGGLPFLIAWQTWLPADPPGWDALPGGGAAIEVLGLGMTCFVAAAAQHRWRVAFPQSLLLAALPMSWLFASGRVLPDRPPDWLERKFRYGEDRLASAALTVTPESCGGRSRNRPCVFLRFNLPVDTRLMSDGPSVRIRSEGRIVGWATWFWDGLLLQSGAFPSGASREIRVEGGFTLYRAVAVERASAGFSRRLLPGIGYCASRNWPGIARVSCETAAPRRPVLVFSGLEARQLSSHHGSFWSALSYVSGLAPVSSDALTFAAYEPVAAGPREFVFRDLDLSSVTSAPPPTSTQP